MHCFTMGNDGDVSVISTSVYLSSSTHYMYYHENVRVISTLVTQDSIPKYNYCIILFLISDEILL